MDNSGRPLWAPWRINFIRSEKEPGCFLCSAEKEPEEKDEKNLIIMRKTHNFIILNRYPYKSGHIMIAPYRHCGDIAELTEDERHEMIDMTVLAKQAISSVMAPDGFNVGFNLGTAAGAGVKDHIHMHIVPRWNGDTNFMPVLAGVHVVPEALKETWHLLRKAIAEKL